MAKKKPTAPVQNLVQTPKRKTPAKAIPPSQPPSAKTPDSFDAVRSLGAAFEKFGHAMQDEHIGIRDLVALGLNCGVVLSFRIVDPIKKVV